MTKRTLFFTTQCFLSLKNRQLVVSFKDETKDPQTVPLEDIGYIILENHAITLTNKLISSCIDENIAVIFCDDNHLPSALLQPFSTSATDGEIVQLQIKATETFKNKLWKNTIIAKISNQAKLLKKYHHPEAKRLFMLAENVSTGDKDNREAVAAKIYWDILFNNDSFKRDRFGEYPNNFLNYGYSILRSAMARALASTGLFPIIGIHHHNKYNSYALVDDIMEPYRIYVDELVYLHNLENKDFELNTKNKSYLLKILTEDTFFKNYKSPLMIALQRTSSSLLSSFKENNYQVLEFPTFK